MEALEQLAAAMEAELDARAARAAQLRARMEALGYELEVARDERGRWSAAASAYGRVVALGWGWSEADAMCALAGELGVL